MKADNDTSIELGQTSGVEKSKSITLPVTDQKIIDSLEAVKSDEQRPESFNINVPSDKPMNPNEVAIRRNLFKVKHKKGTIDVWW